MRLIQPIHDYRGDEQESGLERPHTLYGSSPRCPDTTQRANLSRNLSLYKPGYTAKAPVMDL